MGAWPLTIIAGACAPPMMGYKPSAPLSLVQRQRLRADLALGGVLRVLSEATGYGRPQAGGGVCVHQPAQRPLKPHKGASAHPTPLCILCPLSSHTNLSGPGLFPRLGASRAWSESSPSPAWVFHPSEYK